ncbi:hypothetical protein P154DRAFT_35781 [Amniculicola lignicola CBS 123094]|uniref:Uncharacterized protein n=1 Tax=Amniculicola lignicola CBS 123094 TaxID=1392246 RepID=A0A6A5WU81_9PLEO|nr:hypothetical protein P154DRAFT_35781 [Amniculicola lignicola CBS 123094]
MFVIKHSVSIGKPSTSAPRVLFENGRRLHARVWEIGKYLSLRGIQRVAGQTIKCLKEMGLLWLENMRSLGAPNRYSDPTFRIFTMYSSHIYGRRHQTGKSVTLCHRYTNILPLVAAANFRHDSVDLEICPATRNVIYEPNADSMAPPLLRYTNCS